MKHLNRTYSKLKKELRKYVSISRLLLPCSIILLTSSAGLGASADRLQITFSASRLSAIIENSPLITVLEKLHADAGLEFSVPESAGHQPITAKFNSLPLETALKIILKGFNYSLIYGPKDNVQKINILNRLAADVSQQMQLTSNNETVETHLSKNEEPEPRQPNYGLDQIESAESMEISFPSTSPMNVKPSSNGSMEIEPSSTPMQIDMPKSDDTMKVDFSSQSSE